LRFGGVGTEVDDFVLGVEGGRRVGEGYGFEGREDKLSWIVDEVFGFDFGQSILPNRCISCSLTRHGSGLHEVLTPKAPERDLVLLYHGSHAPDTRFEPRTTRQTVPRLPQMQLPGGIATSQMPMASSLRTDTLPYFSRLLLVGNTMMASQTSNHQAGIEQGSDRSQAEAPYASFNFRIE